MCNCKTKRLSQDLGDEQQRKLVLPHFMRRYFITVIGFNKNFLYVDNCLSKEIEFIWSLGIVTTGCCCGHNFKCPYIGVRGEYSETMKKIGYKVQYNPFDPNNDNEFYPKSVKVGLKFRVNNYFMKLFRIKN